MKSSLHDFYEEKKEILDQIKAYDTIIIHRHKRPDPDALGSQNGLKEIILESFPDKRVLAAGTGVGDLSYLAEMDQVNPADYQDALVIICDTANQPRIDGDLYNLGDKIIKIDHHPLSKDGDYADFSWVNDQASSASEMVAAFWKTFPEELSLNPEAARLLYAGIVGDTNRFLYQATSPETMRLTADLMTYDFDHTALNDQMAAMTGSQAKLAGYVLENLEIRESGAAYVILDQALLEELGLDDQQTSGVVSLPRNIEGVLVWTIFVQQADGSYRCRIRSKGPVINGLAGEHGGGGHPLASGANAADLKEIKEIISKMELIAKQY